MSLAIVLKWAALQRQHISQYTFNGVVKVWMADAASICREIVSHKEFFQSWEGDSLNDSFEKVIVSLVKGMKALSTADASKIIDALSNSPYGQKGTKNIKSAIDAKLSAHNMERSKPSVNVCDVNKQHIKNPLTIFTQDEVSNLQSPRVSESAKFTLIVERHAKQKTKKITTYKQIRLNLIGCTHPHELTVRKLTAMHVLVHYSVLPTAQQRFDKFNELKDAVKTGRKPWPFDPIQEFPECMSELPMDVMEYAYGEDKPITMSCPGLHLVDPKIPMRRFVN